LPRVATYDAPTTLLQYCLGKPKSNTSTHSKMPQSHMLCLCVTACMLRAPFGSLLVWLDVAAMPLHSTHTRDGKYQRPPSERSGDRGGCTCVDMAVSPTCCGQVSALDVLEAAQICCDVSYLRTGVGVYSWGRQVGRREEMLSLMYYIILARTHKPSCLLGSSRSGLVHLGS
jgi:hypothetical protein